MLHLFYIISFLLFLIFAVLCFIKRNIFFVAASVIFAALFIVAVIVSENIVNETVSQFEAGQKAMMAASDVDPNKKNEEFKRQTSSYQQQLADREKQLLEDYPWNKNTIDLMRGPNGTIAAEAMQNVVFTFIANSYNYEAFDTIALFQKVINQPENYIGTHIEMIGVFQSRSQCSGELLEIFPPISNQTLLQEHIVVDEGIHVLWLYYWPSEGSDEYIQAADAYMHARDYTVQGCYIGTYTHDATLYYVIITN